MEIPYTVADFQSILPIVILVGWACMLLILDLFLPEKQKRLTPWLAAAGLVTVLGVTLSQWGNQEAAFNGMFVLDGFSVYLNVLVLASAILTIALSYNYLKKAKIERGEYYIMMMFSISGVMLMTGASDLIVVFLALELLSIPLYILAAFAQPKVESEEAGLKYFLLGAFAGGFVLYGIALVYGATATTNLTEIYDVALAGVEHPLYLTIGAALILVGLGFKIAAVPFHMWTPDVYQGAPTPVTAFMAVIAKVGGFAALLRVFISAFPSVGEDLTPVIWGLAAVTLIVGNVAAIAQTNIKRLLAYSSISHAGFILMAFVPYANLEVQAESAAAALYYLFTFAVTSFGVWAVVMLLERAEDKGLALDDYAGLGKKYPALGLAMLVFMLSFTGIPPTLGFSGKFYLFRAVMKGGFYSLAVLGVITSLVSAYYYLRVVIIMYMKTGSPRVASDPILNWTATLTALATVVLFFFSTPFIQWATDAVLKLF